MFRIRNLFAVALLLGVTVTLYAADTRFERSVNKTVRFTGGKVSIENAFGAVNVHSGSAGEVAIRAMIRTSSDELTNRIKIDIDSSGEGVTIKTRQGYYTGPRGVPHKQ